MQVCITVYCLESPLLQPQNLIVNTNAANGLARTGKKADLVERVNEHLSSGQGPSRLRACMALPQTLQCAVECLL